MSHPRKLHHPKTREEWLRFRHGGIGSSDVGVLLGFSTFKSPYQLWLEKIATEPTADTPTYQMLYGLRQEDNIARYFTEATGQKVRKDNYIRFHAEHKCLLANIDRIILRDKDGKAFENGPGILEIKTVGEAARRGWKEEIPTYYYAQLQHQLSVTGFTWGRFAVAVSNVECIITNPIPIDPVFVQGMNEVSLRFWNENVLKKVAPTWTTLDLDQIYGKPAKTIAHVEPMIPKLARAFVLKEQAGEVKKEYDALKDDIKLYMSDSEGLTVNGELVATWKESTPSPKFDEETFEKEHPELYQRFVKTPEHGTRTLRLVDKSRKLIEQEENRMKLLALHPSTITQEAGL